MKTPNQDRPGGLTRLRESTALAFGRFAGLGLEESDYTWEQAMRVLHKRRRFGLGLAGGLTALVVVAAFLMRDVYRPVARLDVEPPSSGLKLLHEIESAAQAESEGYLETQVQILKSDGLAISVIRELH